MKKQYWCIVGTTDNETDPIDGERLYWSSSWGWVLDGFDIMTPREMKESTLPINGAWELFFDNSPKILA
jgi:hypothetical protein